MVTLVAETDAISSALQNHVLGTHPVETFCVELDGRIIYSNQSASRLIAKNTPDQADNFFQIFHESVDRTRELIRRAAGTNAWQPLALTFSEGGHKGLKLALRCRGLRDPESGHICAVIVVQEQRNHAFEEHRKLIRKLNTELAEQRKIKLRLDKALASEARLHQELIHRVKNNLALLASLIRMKSRLAKSKDVTEALEGIQSRVQSISLVHEVLDQKQEIDIVDVKEMVRRLCDQMQASICPPGVKIECDLTQYLLHVSQATPLALLINELVTNSLKHAFVGLKSGVVEVKLKQNGVDKIEVHVADNGRGFDAGQGQSGTGSQIIEALAKQLGGDLNLSSDDGTSWQLIFKPAEIDRQAA